MSINFKSSDKHQFNRILFLGSIEFRISFGVHFLRFPYNGNYVNFIFPCTQNQLEMIKKNGETHCKYVKINMRRHHIFAQCNMSFAQCFCVSSAFVLFLAAIRCVVIFACFKSTWKGKKTSFMRLHLPKNRLFHRMNNHTLFHQFVWSRDFEAILPVVTRCARQMYFYTTYFMCVYRILSGTQKTTHDYIGK